MPDVKTSLPVLIVLVVAMATITACQSNLQKVDYAPDAQVSMGKPLVPPPCPPNTPSGGMDTLSNHPMPAGVEGLLGNGVCQYMIPEYHDEQRLSNGAGDYGALAKTYAFPNAGTFTSHTDFDGVIVGVAVIVVWPGPVPGPYHALHLNSGLNCLFLTHVHSGATAHWWGIMSPPGPSGLCADATSGFVLLAHSEQPSALAADYPPVTRFVEGHGHKPLVGVRCGNEWCIVGAGSAAAVPPPSHTGAAGAGTSPQWLVKGWFDDQTVGVTTASGSNFGILPSVGLSVVPDSLLGTRDSASFAAGWVTVAQILVPHTVALPNKYRDFDPGFGLDTGMNTLAIHVGLESGAQVWRGRIANGRYPAGRVYPVPVTWADHRAITSFVPATARFRWNDKDEEIWVRCDVGCCLVRGRI